MLNCIVRRSKNTLIWLFELLELALLMKKRTKVQTPSVHDDCAGQAVVQFAEDVEDRSEYAVKFFLDYESFLTEAAIYAACFPHIHSRVSDEVRARADATAGLGMDGVAAVQMSDITARFLPHVEAVCDGSSGKLVDPQGRPLPPCIVLEKGESLYDWIDRAQPDLFTSLAVRCPPKGVVADNRYHCLDSGICGQLNAWQTEYNWA